MKLAIMQPYIFPYIGYFQLIAAVDKFVIYDDVNFITRGWINRNNILVSNQSHLFTIPLKDASQNRLIREIEVMHGNGWEKKFLKTIEQAYKKAPFFTEFFPVISAIVNADMRYISELACSSIYSIAEYIGIPTKFVNTSSIYDNVQLKAQERILDICRQEQVSGYINPVGGMEIYSKPLFEQSGIALNFLKTRLTPYRQFGGEFVPSLSIIDVLMFNSRESMIGSLNEYDLL
jgi:WbqC-like protein family